MPIDEDTAHALALMLHDEPLAEVVSIKSLAPDTFLLCFTDRRDGRTHVVLELAQVVAWLDSIVAGRVLQPDYAVCEVCDSLHGERDRDGELRNVCRRCLIELLRDGLGGGLR